MTLEAMPDAVRRSDSPLSTGTLDVMENLVPHIPSDRSVLEIGCGNGHLSELILRRNNRLLALDISAAAIEECRRKLGDRAQFVQGDVLTFQTDERFDYAFINEVLDQIPDDVGVLSAVFRLLQPGGRLVLSTPVSPERFCKASIHIYSEDEIRSKIERAGFVIETADSYGGLLSYLAAVASNRIGFSKPVLAFVRGLPLYEKLLRADAKLRMKKDRVILVGKKPS